MRLVRLLRQTYSGDEFLILEQDTYKRLKIVLKEAVGDRVEELADFLTKLSRLKHPAIAPIEGFDFRSETPQIFFAYYGGEDIDFREPQEAERFAGFLLNLLRELIHHGVAIPIIGLQDFLKKDEDFYMIAPCWRNPRKFPRQGVFIAPEFVSYAESSVASTAYVFGRMILSLSKDESIKDIVSKFTQEEPSERKLHFVVTANSLDGLSGRVRVRPVVLARREEAKILDLIKDLKPKLNTILIYGPQRSGKTTLLSLLVDDFRRMGMPAVWVTSVENLVMDLVQLLDNETYSSLDETTKNNISRLMSLEQLSSDEVILTVAKLLSRMRSIVFLVDDAHEMSTSVKMLLKQLGEYVYPQGHILLLSSIQDETDIRVDFKVRVNPLSFEEALKLVSQSLAIDEKNIPQEFVQWLYTVTQGLAGKITQVLKVLARENKLSVSGDRLHVDETFLTGNLNDVLELSVEKYKSTKTAFLSLCGEKFSPVEIQALREAIGLEKEELDRSLRNLMKDGLVYFENERFRFTLPELWRSLYESVERSIRDRAHSSLALKVPSYEKRAWHLRMLGKAVSAAAMYLRAARKEIDSYGDVSAALDYINKAQEILKGRTSYALVSLKFKALSIKGEPKSLKQISEELKTVEKFSFFRYAALVVAGEVNEAMTLEQEIDFKGETPYSELFKLSYKVRRMLRAGQKVDQETIKRLSLLTARLSNLPLHNKLKASALMLIARARGIESIHALEFLNTAKLLAEEGRFYDVLAEVLLLLGTRLTTAPEAQRLFEQVVEIANRIGSHDLMMTALSNMMWTNLYRGETEKMFAAIHQLRELSKMVDSAATEAYTYFVEAQYHTYNKQLEEALEDLERERSIEKRLGIEERGLRAKVAAYALNGRLEEARKLVKENIDNPALSNPTFVEFRDLILAESDEDLLKAWKRFVNKDHLYWMQEACQAFGARIALLDRDSFFRFAERLERSDIKDGTFLSLAQVLEGMSLAYKALGEELMALNYAERAVTIYRTHGFDSAADWLEQKVGMASAMSRLVRLFDTARIDEGDVRSMMKELRSLLKSFIDAHAVTQYALDTLKVADFQDDLKSILDFLLSRMMNILPINSAALMLVDGSGKIVEFSAFNVRDIPQKLTSSYEPFEVYHVVQLAHNYRLHMYLANRSLFMNRAQGESLMKMVLNLQEVAAYILRNAISYRRSITDPLTGLYTRWYFLRRLREEFERVKRYGGSFSVVMADIDDFKKINDTYGHRIGDEVLKFIASLMRSHTRSTDILGRYGGEEFIMILPNTDKESAGLVCEKILRNMSSMNPFDFKVTMSFGVAGYPEDEVFEPEELIALADKAMYRSKERGKACVTIYR